MILISSSAYVVNEFQLELGKIPPCFLPIGNKKLIEHQIVQLRKKYSKESIYVSLPENYELSQSEIKLLHELKVQYIVVPDNFSLSESISYVLNVVGCDQTSLKLIYGDTLIQDLPEASVSDILGLAFSQDGYNWYLEDTINDIPLIWCGFYIFSSKQKLLQCLALNREDFTQAVQAYRKAIALAPYICKEWFDLGHINTYYRSRANITTQRSFNQLHIENGIVYKTGLPKEKIIAEGTWFKRIPAKMKVFTPQLIQEIEINNNNAVYALEYLPNLPLNELFVHGRNYPIEWKTLFLKIKDFFNLASSHVISDSIRRDIDEDFIELVKEKTFSRLNILANTINLDANKVNFYDGEELPSLKDICNNCIANTLLLKEFPAIMHGDLCFSNILFDSRTQRIKVIDPRGINHKGHYSIFGDQKYDLAKLTHSVLGLYDHIIAGRYNIILPESNMIKINFDIDQRILDIQKIFRSSELIEGLEIDKIIPLVILLFISMIPLHSDRPDRQKAMYVNALRLYSEYKEHIVI